MSAGHKSEDVDAPSADLSNDVRRLADRVRRLKSCAGLQRSINKPHLDLLGRRIRELADRCKESDARFEKETQDRRRRHFLIVKPDATEDEITQAIIGGTNTQIFEQALMGLDRRGEAQSALSNVRKRGTDLERIERDMYEIRQLIEDLDEVVSKQEPMV